MSNISRLSDWAPGPDPLTVPLEPLPSGSPLADLLSGIHSTFEATGVDAKSYARLLHDTGEFYETLDADAVD
jgi:hypothetical protein